jgi:hypothetical protein
VRLNLANKGGIDLIDSQNDAMAMGARNAFEDIANVEDRKR